MIKQCVFCHGFAFDAYNFDSMSEDNRYVFFWFDLYNSSDNSAIMVVNPEGVDENGCYSDTY